MTYVYNVKDAGTYVTEPVTFNVAARREVAKASERGQERESIDSDAK